MTNAWCDDLAAILCDSTVFRDLDEHEVRSLVGIARRRVLDPDDILWQWGEAGDGLAVVLEGALQIQRLQGDRGVEIFRRMGRGEMVGFSTVAGEVHTADVVAAGPTTIAVLRSRDLRQVLGAHPGIALAFIAYLGHLVGLLSDERAALREPTVKARICRWLREHHEDGDRVEITHEDLAHRLDASRENVSRALKRLEKHGVLDLERGYFLVLALDRCDGA